MGSRDAIGGRFFACGARADVVGFATVRVALARRGVRVRGAPPAAIVEFEFAPSPTIRNVVTHAGLVPGRVVDVNAAFWNAADRETRLFVATDELEERFGRRRVFRRVFAVDVRGRHGGNGVG